VKCGTGSGWKWATLDINSKREVDELICSTGIFVRTQSGNNAKYNDLSQAEDSEIELTSNFPLMTAEENRLLNDRKSSDSR
jgi:hypothetical protein